MVLSAAAAVIAVPARAECILRPDPAAAPEGSHWSLRTDPATSRRCWVLVDSAGHSAAPAAPPPPADASPPSSTLGSFFSNLVSPSPQQQPVAAEPPPEPAPVVRKPPRTATAAPRRGAQQPAAQPPAAQQKGNYSDMTPEQREALFAAFMRWKASRQGDDGGEAKDPPH